MRYLCHYRLKNIFPIFIVHLKCTLQIKTHIIHHKIGYFLVYNKLFFWSIINKLFSGCIIGYYSLYSYPSADVRYHLLLQDYLLG